MKYLLIAIACLGFMTSAFADSQKIDRMTADTMESFTSSNMKWADEPLLPKGAKSALMVGDPSKAGIFIVRLKFPPNYQIPAHTHPYAEVITILKGKLGNGMGQKFDAASGEVLNQSDSFVLPAGHAHYAWTTDEEAIVELIATGPWGISYINPDDDPRINK